MAVLSSSDRHRFSAIKPRPVKVRALVHPMGVHRTALQLVDHIQVLEHVAPDAIVLLEQWARQLRARIAIDDDVLKAIRR